MIPDTEMLIGATLRSMREAVIPAIDTESSIALGHATLIVDALESLLQLAPYQYETVLNELQVQTSLVAELQAVLASHPHAQEILIASADAADAAIGAVAQPIKSEQELVALTQILRQLSDQLVRLAFDQENPQVRKSAGRIVLAHADREAKLPKHFNI